MPDEDMLICGAGPTGLVLALWLTALGVRVRIIDAAPVPGTTSRALGVQARTLELYRQLGLADAVVAAGHKAPAINFWADGRHRARLPFAAPGDALTAFPYLLILPQDAHERLLTERLATLGVEIERGTRFVGMTQDAGGVEAALQGPDGVERRCRARYVAGCDGAHSAVRKALGVAFPGGTYSRIFYVADVVASGPVMNGEVHVAFDKAADFLAVFPLAASGHGRLVGTILDEHAERLETLTFDDISPAALSRLGIDVATVNWFSTYRVHHRVADRFGGGRAFLLGDAAHIHSPAGGQGMNTGIGDAINLAWKLAAVLGRRADARLLDSYAAERRAFALGLVATTDRVFTVATSETRRAQLGRTRVAPLVVPLVARVPALRRFAFRTVAQLALSYRHGPLAEGRAGRVRGGDRLPWIGPDDGNHAPLAAMMWQVHVYGTARADLAGWCREQAVPLHVFAWSPRAAGAGLARDAAYLIRPDGYIAFASADPAPAAIARFLADRAIVPSPGEPAASQASPSASAGSGASASGAFGSGER